MLSLVMLSLGASFAADDNVSDALAIDEEITIDDSLAVVEEDVVSDVETSSIIINNTNLHDYIDSAGGINENITADELIFDGNFENLNLSVDRPFIITGSNSTLTNPNILLISSNVTFKGFTITQTKGVNSVFIGGLEESPISDVTLSGLTIDYADDGKSIEAIAVRVANTNNFKLLDSVISYVGNTTSYYVNNAVLVSNSSSPVIKGNKFKLSLVSSAVGWAEVPAGSGNWVSSPMSEGIVVDSSSEVMFEDNIVNITYNGVSGDYDTIYGIDFKDSAYTAISGNTIFVSGHSYVYGIIISGFNFVIDNNTINVESDNYYANGIDVEGPAFGEVKNNEISVNGVQSAYGIYSGMNGQNVSAIYTNNTLSGKAYNVFGMSLGDVESQIDSSNIALDGNYTTGIAYYGNSINITNSRIILNSSEVGNESIWESFGVEAVGIKVIKGDVIIRNNVIATPGKGISLTGNETPAYLVGNFINVVANKDKDAYAIYSIGSPVLVIMGNDVDYQGTTQGTGINNAVYLNKVNMTLITANKFDLDLVSSYVPWAEVPAGSGNWVSSPVSEGIVISETNNALFGGNVINVTYGDVVGSYDTIYAVDFKNSDNAIIAGNEINAKGHTYIYGIIISGDNFTIDSNNITSESDIYYANGIDVEGPATGVISNNGIMAKGVTSAYPIYSGMNGQAVSVNYTGNDLVGDAYLVIGMSLGDVESNIANSGIVLTGNYTKGIAYRGSKLTVDNTQIVSKGSNVGDQYVWEAFGVATAGIQIANGNATITNNNIETTANYAIDANDNAALVHDNYLMAKKFTGDDSVSQAAKSNVYNNTPIIPDENKTSAQIAVTEVCGNGTVGGIFILNGTPAKETLTYSVAGINGTVETDASGVFSIDNVPNGQLIISYPGDSFTLPSSAVITLKDIAPAREATVINAEDYTTYAIDFNAGERGNYFKVQLVDVDGKPLANKTVKIGFNGVVYNKTTNETGWAELQINLKKAGVYTFAIAFLGDDDYNASFTVQKITVNKKKTSISASDKSFKASAKTKSYTVTLKTDAGSSIDGKAYMSAGKKVTLKVNGKTYTGKTNSKGQVTFKLSLTKKGKYVSSIKFAGDDMYSSSSKSVKITIK